MHVDIVKGPGSAAAKVNLNSGEHFTAEAGSMIAMSAHIQLETTTHKKGSGGILKAAKRLLAGESFFLNHYTSRNAPGQVILSTPMPGDMLVHQLDNERLVVQAGSFVASQSTVNMETGWQGFKSLLSGESFFWLNMSGSGLLVLSSYGCIYPIEVNGETIVDTGHIVAFDETLQFSITKAGGSWVSSFLGGEGLVCKFQGRGRVWCQSHNPSSFGKTLGPKLRPR